MIAMMRFVIFAGIIVALGIAGCGTMFTPPGTIPVSEGLSPEAQIVQGVINETNALLISFNNVVGQQKADGIITAAKRDAYLDTSDSYGETIDKAQKALRGGDILGAKNQAELVKKLITELHRQVATGRPQ